MTPVDPALMPACHEAVAVAAADPTVEGWLPAAAVLLAGLLGTMMPCTVQMAVILSSLLAPTTGDEQPPSRVVWFARVSGFLGGYILTFLVAAGLAALLVQAAGWVVGISTLQVAGGLVLAAFGLQMLGWLRLPGGGPCGGPVGFFLGRPYHSTPRPGRMGMTFAVYCAGCCGPAALGSALLLGGAGSAAGAAFMLLVYAAGMAIPFIVLAAGLSFALRSLKVALRFAPAMTVAGGCVAVIAGAVLALKPLSVLIGG
jgi:cytochrome c-type biogenesis protein